MVRPLRKRARGVSKYGQGASGYGTYINVPPAALAPFRPGIDRRNVGTLRVANAEKKLLDTSITLAAAATGGLVEDSLCHIAQGTAENQRIGRSITIHNLDMKGYINFPEHATISADLFRVIVFIDSSANGTAAAVLDILETADQSSFRNLANSGRFHVLRDSYDTINSNTADAASNYGQVVKPWTFNWYSRDGLKIDYSLNTGGMAEIRTNNIGVLFINNWGTSTFTATARIRYTDA